MTNEEYQKEALRTLPKSCCGDELLLASHAALGIAGEAGEIADHIKKYLHNGHDLDREKLIKEAGDILWYVNVLCVRINCSLGEIMDKNIEKLRIRYPNGYSHEASKERRDCEMERTDETPITPMGGGEEI